MGTGAGRKEPSTAGLAQLRRDRQERERARADRTLQAERKAQAVLAKAAAARAQRRLGEWVSLQAARPSARLDTLLHDTCVPGLTANQVRDTWRLVEAAENKVTTKEEAKEETKGMRWSPGVQKESKETTKKETKKEAQSSSVEKATASESRSSGRRGQ